jgi:aryl-alcohol dehydrogenase-like predicted oxidoreductase
VNNPDMGGRMTPHVLDAVAAYLGIAQRHGLDPAQMAIAWCLTRPFPVIPIIGATNLAQLQVGLGAADVRLSADILAALDAAHRAHPSPY